MRLPLRNSFSYKIDDSGVYVAIVKNLFATFVKRLSHNISIYDSESKFAENFLRSANKDFGRAFQ